MTTQGEFYMIKEMRNRGMFISDISKATNRSEKTIRKVISSDEHKPYLRATTGSKLDPYKEYILKRMDEGCLNGMVIYDEIINQGYTGKITILRDFMHPHRKRCKQKAYKRFETGPGEQAQVDWGEFTLDHNGIQKRIHAFVMVMGYSRAIYVEFVENEKLQTLIECHERAFNYFGGVPKTIVYDNMRTVVKNIKASGLDRFNKTFLSFASHQGFRPVPTRPYHPQSKGKVENGVKYVRRNFWPRLKEITGIDDLNNQVKHWVHYTANTRLHGTTKEVPAKRLLEEPLSPVNDEDFRITEDMTRKVTSDCFVSYQSNRYSVPHKYAGRVVYIRDRLNGSIDIYSLDGKLLCSHIKTLGKHNVSKNKEHFEGLSTSERTVAAKAPILVPTKDSKVHIRPLTVYDDMIDSEVKPS